MNLLCMTGFAFACTFIFTVNCINIRCHISWNFSACCCYFICSEFNSFLFFYLCDMFCVYMSNNDTVRVLKKRAKIDKQRWERERSKHYLWFMRWMQMIIHFSRCGTCVQKWMKVIALAVFHSLYSYPKRSFSLNAFSLFAPATHGIWFKNLNCKQIVRNPRTFLQLNWKMEKWCLSQCSVRLKVIPVIVLLPTDYSYCEIKLIWLRESKPLLCGARVSIQWKYTVWKYFDIIFKMFHSFELNYFDSFQQKRLLHNIPNMNI